MTVASLPHAAQPRPDESERSLREQYTNTCTTLVGPNMMGAGCGVEFDKWGTRFDLRFDETKAGKSRFRAYFPIYSHLTSRRIGQPSTKLYHRNLKIGIRVGTDLFMIVRGGAEGIQRVERVNEDLEGIIDEVNEGSESGEDTLEDINDVIQGTNRGLHNSAGRQQDIYDNCEETTGKDCGEAEDPGEIGEVDEDLDVELDKSDYTLDPAIGMLEGAVSGFVRGSFLEVYVQFHNDVDSQRPIYAEISLGTNGALLLKANHQANQKVLPQALYLRSAIKF